MRKLTKCAMGCTMAIMAASMMFGTAAMAQEESDVIAIPYLEEGAFDEIVMTNDDTVETGINIRESADANSKVVGHLYRGGAAWVINKGEKWTEVCSGDITGFIDNDYLVYGNEVRGLAEHYGIEGVKTTWEEVKRFAGADAGSGVVEKLEAGESFVLVEDQGHWLKIQNIDDKDDVSYVSCEDVTHVLLFDTAVDKDGDFVSLYDRFGDGSYTYYEESDDDDTYYEETDSEPTYTAPSDTTPSAPQTETPQTQTPQTETPQTQAPQTEAPQTEPPQTEAPATEAPAEDDSYGDDEDIYYEEDDSSDESIDTGDDGWYDADTDTWYDANGNVVTGSYDSSYTETEEYVEETYAEETYVEETYTEETYVEETYTEETYVEETYTEETYAEETEAVSAGSDDTSLLAALIYCEAGNQSYEGMVAVGAVVMNRVYSASFPNSISEVIYQSGQFSPASSGWLDSALASGVPSTCYDAAAAAIGGENPVPGALYFNTGSGQGVQIGDHQFY